ncbi:MAG TPA: PPK2 family polyphosphate kinase [Flavipsychrobacter sp.]|nr:PPK2 family polyphosphate kinase [Flavipsychrobacter sp.]
MLEKINTRAPESLDKEETKKKTKELLKEISDLQNLLYAEGKHSVLVIIQGMDGSGKDGLIKDVFTSINPLGINTQSFKAPTEEELKHDFLWRIHRHVPEKGKIMLFNRSHYEDVLIARVHEWIDDEVANRRMEAINAFEKLLQEHNGTVILKLYMHISRKEQKEQLKERMTNPEKMWKYNKNDFIEAEKWDRYMECYEDVFEKCNTVPWHIIPTDQNWYKAYLVAQLLRDTLKKLDMQYPSMKN